MSRSNGEKKDIRRHELTVWVTDDEYDDIHDLSKKLKISMSEMLRFGIRWYSMLFADDFASVMEREIENNNLNWDLISDKLEDSWNDENCEQY